VQSEIAQAGQVVSADGRQLSWAQDRAVVAGGAADAEQRAGGSDGVEGVGHFEGRACGVGSYRPRIYFTVAEATSLIIFTVVGLR
jgi:hypothetical protein